METPRPARFKRRARPLAELVREALGPALAKRGFGAAEIVARWDVFVGPRLAAASEPLKLDWPRDRRGGGEDGSAAPATLVVRA
ncbi:MAG: DUF721 domain-containing protein, partial [Hyphomicrobiales bacterium]|nr:DUF721 domain-containing protein [Hyphomicrobiales bacterium]